MRTFTGTLDDGRRFTLTIEDAAPDLKMPAALPEVIDGAYVESLRTKLELTPHMFASLLEIPEQRLLDWEKARFLTPSDQKFFRSRWEEKGVVVTKYSELLRNGQNTTRVSNEVV